jgi:hypothetical protein
MIAAETRNECASERFESGDHGLTDHRRPRCVRKKAEDSYAFLELYQDDGPSGGGRR